ncbi:MAG: hypothetical protein EHM87_20480 [Burkholderiales bacterium]|nr:MAG: hypothetical protein EHM87_20480 [Burkholderiales bacterium]
MQSASNNDSLPTYHKSKIIDPFAGGRCLNAVYHRDDLTGIQTAIMIYFGGRLDFRDFLHSKITVSVSQICKAIKFKETAVRRAIKELIEMGYIYVENNFDERGFKIENTYSISDYFFKCYVDSLLSHVVDSRETMYDSRETMSNIPVFNDPLSEAQRSEEKENKINQLSLKSRGSEAEGEPLSQHRIDAQEERNLISPMANEPPPIEIDDMDFDFDSVQNQFSKRIGKAKTNDLPNKEFKIVTDLHKKMIAIFRPTDPILKKKCFVKDNDIHFFTDQILIKYGHISQNVIDILFTDMVEAGKCGQIAWDVNKAYQRVEIAYQRWLKLEKKNE